MVASTLVLRRNRALPSVAFRRIAFVHARRLLPIRVLHSLARVPVRISVHIGAAAASSLHRAAILRDSSSQCRQPGSRKLGRAANGSAGLCRFRNRPDWHSSAAQRSAAQRSAALRSAVQCSAVQCKQSPDGRTRTCARTWAGGSGGAKDNRHHHKGNVGPTPSRADVACCYVPPYAACTRSC